MTKGWHNEPQRHSLAARGIKTTACGRGRNKATASRRKKARRLGEQYAYRYSSMDSLAHYGTDSLKRDLERLGVYWGEPGYGDLMEEFFKGFEKANPPPLLRTRDEIKKAIIKLVDHGHTDIRDIDAALYEVDFHDEIDELVKDGVLEERDTDFSTDYLRMRSNTEWD